MAKRGALQNIILLYNYITHPAALPPSLEVVLDIVGRNSAWVYHRCNHKSHRAAGRGVLEYDRFDGLPRWLNFVLQEVAE